MKKKIVLAIALVLCLALSACGSKAPSQEEVESAIRDGSVTLQDALDKGWVTQEWVDSYLEENTVPAADKIAINMVGEFETETMAGDAFTNENLPKTAFLAFIDPEDSDAETYYNELVHAVEDVQAAGADIVVCNKGDMNAELFQDAPFSVISYNDSMKEALGHNGEMASGSPCTGVWYVDGSLVSAWISKADADSLTDSAASFAAMSSETSQDNPEGSTEGGTEDSVAAMPMG